MTTYRLGYPTAGRAAAPALDEFQQSVVDHPGGPLLVLAGPGTGKTTTLVEAIVDRIEHRGAAPDSVLALTFSRKAAEQLRDRVTARLGRTMATTLELDVPLLRLRPGPPLLAAGGLRRAAAAALRPRAGRRPAASCSPTRPSRCAGPSRWPRRSAPAASPREVQAVLARAQEKGLGYEGLRRLGLEEDRPELVAAADLMRQYVDVLDSDNLIDYPESDRRGRRTA